MFTAEKHFINVIRPQPSSSPFYRAPFLFLSIPFRLLFPFLLPLARYLAFTLSYHFSFPIFLSSCLYAPPPLPLSVYLSSLYSLPLWTFSLCDFVFLPLISFCFRNDVRSANISSPLLGGFGIGADVFRLNERRAVGRNDDAVDDAVCGDSSSSRKRTWYILSRGQMCALLGSSGIINDTHRFL